MLDRCQFCAQETRSEIVLAMTCYRSRPWWVIHMRLPIFVCQVDLELDHGEIDLGRRPMAVRDAWRAGKLVVVVVVLRQTSSLT